MRKTLIIDDVGFIGSALVRYIINETSDTAVTVDKLIYAGNPTSLAPVAQSKYFASEKVGIRDRAELARVFTEHQPDCAMRLVAESHVDHSIDGPAVFVETNTAGTYTLPEATWAYWNMLTEDKKLVLRFHYISTDEVYGDLHSTDDSFTETASYTPNSPYSASKASSDRLVRAWLRIYGPPTLITNCPNNYGPYHFPEKLIPLMILNTLAGKPLPVYGNGQQICDWLYAEDHARALCCAAAIGKVSETYNIGGHNKRKSFDVAETVCELLEEPAPNKPHGVTHYRDLIIFAADRPGHDLRYAVDVPKIVRGFDWPPQETFESGMRKTVQWYLASESWWKQVQNGSYQGERLGLKG